MALDDAQYISELEQDDPPFNDPLGEADDHIRTVKRATKQSFPNVDKAVTTTADQLNFVEGVTSSIQTQLDAITANLLEAGTLTNFFNAAAPTGWTLDTTHNNKALRIVNDTGGGSAGAIDFTTAFSSSVETTSVDNHTHTLTIGEHQLTEAEMAVHSHSTDIRSTAGGFGGVATNQGSLLSTVESNSTGGDEAHGHTGSTATEEGGHSHASNLDVQYVDAIICIKDAF